ncbi:MAG: glutathione S-transferase family protein [Methylophaga sp.]|nr:glutathione S-transferase family protein [Methylophaga sp.]
MIKIYGKSGTRSTRVLWALEEAGADYEFITVDLGKGEAKQDAYLKLNPGAKVPSLVHNDLVLTESAAICTYIGDLFPDSKLVPAYNSSERAIYNQSCYFAMTELEQALWSMAKHRFALPKEFRIRDMITTATYEFEKALDVFSVCLGDREFLVGDNFTCADLITASILKWAAQGGKRARSLRHDNVEQYLGRILSREAFVRAQAREQD